MKAYKIGRSINRADIVLPNMSTQVSSVHLEFIKTDDGRFYINDLSKNGTFIFTEDEKWMKVKQSYVNGRTRLRLADCSVSVNDLLKLIEEKTPSKVKSKEKAIISSKNEGVYRGKIERNPETGEIIRR